jgi:subtilisin-like proprotein convertase family protein
MLKTLLFSLLLFVTCLGNAQSIWRDVDSDPVAIGDRRIIPSKYRLVHLDVAGLQSMLSLAPERFSPEATTGALLFNLPMPDGRNAQFRLTESPVMAPELQAKYSDTRCYTGVGVDDPTASLKCDLTPWGFHAMVRSSHENTIFIDPFADGDRENYVVYYKKDYQRKNNDIPFTCGAADSGLQPLATGNPAPEIQGDCKLRKYRLALACSGEYASFFGGTKPLVLAAMNTTMNRVNGVYENDLAITMILVAKNDTLIFLNAATDPYTNNNGSTMLGQNQTTCNNRIGTANYDIGHVFSTGGGGIAGLGVVCGNTKAQGVTGSSSPVGDGYDIDYVAHEMGHEFGGNHTFNGTTGSCGGGNINQSTADEPGSATTIMGYAGICGVNDIQPHSDDYFHAISIQEIITYTNTGAGNGCPVKIVTGNNNPTVNAGADYIIPKSTFFALTATGSDPDGDALTYCWEEMDPEASIQPPVSTNAKGPLFRSFKGTTSPTRTFPRLVDIINNVTPAWEKLPSVARTMKFRVTARDNHAVAGCTSEDDMVITVSAAAGPFTVLTPNTNVTWLVGDSKTVTWDVKNTNAAPVNCANVKISLSTDGGYTYPVVLAPSVPNNGSAVISVPNNVSTTCRLKVEAVGNVFFDISDQNFQIQVAPVPTFTLAASTGSIEVCAGNTATFNLSTTSINNFTSPIQISLTGAPAGAVVGISPNPLTAGSMATVTVSGITPAMAGNYTLAVQAIGGTVNQLSNVQLNILPGAPAAALTSSPADGATGVAVSPTLLWNHIPFTQGYHVIVATDPLFSPSSTVFDQMLTDTSVLVPGLQPSTVYYWTVTSSNDCGSGPVSTLSSFQVINNGCGQVFNSTDVPKTIDVSTAGTTTSSLTVPINKPIAKIKVHLTADHSYVGDLSAQLLAPWGQAFNLFDQPGVPADPYGCPNDNLDLVFDDAAVQTADDLENTCNATGIALLGTFQSIDTLAKAIGHSSLGDWQMAVTDNQPDDGGAITSWSIEFCFQASVPVASVISNNPLTVPAGGNRVVSTTYLQMTTSGTTAQEKFTLLALPQHGSLTLSGVTLTLGGGFTQADIDSGNLVYTHNGDNSTSDNFHFDALDQNNQAWLHNGIFNLIIIQNNLAATAGQTGDVLCNNSTDGKITVMTTGLDGQYQYSINGGPQQASNEFDHLSPGSYTITVTGQYGFTTTAGPVVLANPTAVTATNTVSTDTITVAAGGGAGNYQYSLDGIQFQASAMFTGLANGVYTVVVKDANGCTGTTEAHIAVNTLHVNAGVSVPVHCKGGSDGSIVVDVAGGKAPFAYSLNSGQTQPGNIFTGLSAGTYTVQVMDADGFVSTSNQVVLTDPTLVVANNSVSADSINVSATGGTGTFTYSLDGMVFQMSGLFTAVANGIYAVVVMDGNGCTATTQAIVAVNSLLAYANQSSPVHCHGGADGSITATIGGGLPPFTYSLNGGSLQSGNTFSGLAAGTYSIEVKDAQGFTASTNPVILTEPSAITASGTATLNKITVSASGGTGVLSYSIDGQQFQASNIFGSLSNGDYTVVVRDENGCTATTQVTVSVPALAGTAAQTHPIGCNGDHTGEITVTGSGGVPPYQYSLNGGAFQSDNVFPGLNAGAYNVSIKDDAGSIVNQIDLTVSEPAAISVTVTVIDNNATVNTAGGTPPYAYALNGNPVSGFSNLPIGQYDLLTTDANGCTATTHFEVFGNTIASTLTVIKDTVTCNGYADGIASLCINGGYPPFQVSITPPANPVTGSGPCEYNASLSSLAADNYTVVVTDVHGYSQTVNFTIHEAPAIVATAHTVFDTIFLTASGGSGPLSYSIDGGLHFQSSPVFPNLPPGTYAAVIADNHGCTFIDLNHIVLNYVAVVEPASFWGAAVAPNPASGQFMLTIQQAPAALQASVYDAAGRYMHSWNFEPGSGTFSTLLDLSDLPQGIYFLRLTDGKNAGGMRLSIIR